jgi:hypothetical protein
LLESEWVFDDRLFAIQPMFDVNGPFVAQAFEVPCFLLEERATATTGDEQNQDCRDSVSTVRMERSEHGEPPRGELAREFRKLQLNRQAEFGSLTLGS